MAVPAAVLNLAVIANTKAANVALAGTQARLRGVAATSTKTGMTMGKAMAGIGIAAGAAAVAIVKVGEEFDNAYDTIRSRTDATGKEMRKLKDSFRDVVGTTPTDFDTAARAVSGLRQHLDITGRPLTRLAKQMTSLAKITGEDIDTTVTSATRLFGDWSVATDKQTKKMDQMFRVTRVTGIGINDLTQLMVQFGSPLRELGFSFDEAAVMFARFEREGVNMQTLLPGLRMGLKNLSLPTDDLKDSMEKLNVTGSDTREKLLSVFEAISSKNVSEADKVLLGSQVFGGRAWADMNAAIKEGRFEFDELISQMKNSDATIRQTEQNSRDLSENWTIFTNNLKLFVEPVARKVFEALGQGMRALNKLDLNGAIKALKDFWQSAGFLRDVVSKVFSGLRTSFSGFKDFVKGVVQVISGIFSGDFKRAWEGLKNIFSSGVKQVIGIFKTITSPIRAAARGIGDLLGNVFSGAWDRIKDIFESGKDAVVGFLNLIIKAINVLPFIPDIGLIGGGGGKGKGGGAITQVAQNVAEQHFTGGKITKPMAIVGEEAPRHPEFVLATNPAYRNRNLGLWAQAGAAMGVPGFASGGLLGGKPQDAFSNAGDIIDKLPSPGDLPEFFQPLGSGLVKAAAKYIRDKAASVVDVASSAAKGVTNTADVGQTLKTAGEIAQQFGLSISSGYRDPAHNASVGGVAGSLHTHGSPTNPGAVDLVGSYANMLAAYQWAQKNLNLQELLLHDAGSGLHVHLGFFKKGGILQRLAKGGVIGRPIPKALQKFNKIFPKHVSPDYGGYAMPASAVAMLAEFFGMPGTTFAQIAKGESAYRPGAVGDDAAAGYGNTFGYGLWQITTGASGMDAVVNRMGGYEKMLNPIANAIIAAKMYKARGVSPWLGTRYMTGSNLHWTGSMGDLVRAGGSGGGSGGSGGSSGGGGGGATGAVGPGGGTGSGKSKALRHLLKTIDRLRSKVPDITARIANAEILDAMSTSPMGSELSPEERAGQIGLWQKLIDNATKRAALISEALPRMLKGPAKKKLRQELATLNDITGGEGSILAARVGLDRLLGESGAVSDNLQQRLDLTQQLLQSSNLRYAVSQAQYKTLSQVPYAGAFARGGVVPGPIGSPALATVHGGETIIPPDTNVTVHIDGPAAMKWLENYVTASIDRSDRKKGRSASKPSAGARGF